MRRLGLIFLGAAIGFLMAMPFRWQRGAAMPSLSIEDSIAERELDRVVPAVNIDVMPFDRAVEEIQKLTPAQIAVDWDSIASCGSDRNSRVAVHGKNMLLWQVLEELTEMQSRSAIWNRISYKVSNGRIVILKASQCVTARLYDAHDLISDIVPSARDLLDSTGPVTERERMDALAELIKSSVAPQSWNDGGHDIGMIHAGGGHLYITQDCPTHRRISQFLYDLRATDNAVAPVTIESERDDFDQTCIFPKLSRKFEAILRAPIERVDLDNVPLDRAIDTLQKLSGVVIAANWAALERANVPRDLPVSVKARGAPLPSVLQSMFAHAATNASVDFAVENGIVTISADGSGSMIRFYDVRDFLTQSTPTEREQVLDNLINFIIDTVDPDGRKQHGESLFIREFRGRLLVSQTWSNHEQIAAELAAIRKNGGRFRQTRLPRDQDVYRQGSQ